MSQNSYSLKLLPLALAGLLAACGGSSAPPAASPPPPAAVTVWTMKAQEVALTRELPGRVAASLIAEVRPQVSGIVKRRLFTEGSLVKAGQPLYQLDDAAYRADTNSARASVERAQATLESARLTAKRLAELVAVEAVSTQENENAIAALRQAQADLGVSKAALDGRQVILDYARIASPINGRIGKSSVTQGALVTAGQAAPLATVQQTDPIYIDLTQSASELLQLRKEMAAGTLTQSDNVPVTILLEDGTPYEHAGKMAFSEISVDPSTGSFALRVTVKNPNQVLMPGMYVRAAIGNGERSAGLLVPQQGIARDPKGNSTAMVVADGKVQVRPVQVSRTIGDKWLVDSGLAAGDQVIVEGLQKIKPGMDVTATEASADAAPAVKDAAPTAAPAK